MYSIKIHPLAVASVHNNYYLSQYLAFLNPIEECFSVIKSCVKNLLHFNVENCTATRGRQDDDCSGLGGLSPHVVTPFSRLVRVMSNDHHGESASLVGSQLRENLVRYTFFSLLRTICNLV